MIKEFRHVSQVSQMVLKLFSENEIKELMEAQIITSYELNKKPYYYKPKELEEELLKLAKEIPRRPYGVIPILVDKLEITIHFELQHISDRLVHFKSEVFSGVYFLCKKNKVVYVGKAVSIAARIANHFSEKIKDFDTVFYLPLPKNRIEEVEREFIKHLQPEYNIQNNPLYYKSNQNK
jgi:hypothetical protein